MTLSKYALPQTEEDEHELVNQRQREVTACKDILRRHLVNGGLLPFDATQIVSSIEDLILTMTLR